LFLGYFTLGITWLWCLIDLFNIPSKVNKYNLVISNQVTEIEKGEKEEMHSRNMAMIAASEKS